jgi:hypothetical protein
MENETAAEASALVVSRSFDAPREAVFDAWLDPTQLAIWMGPHGVRAEVDALEPKEGGKYRIIMHPEPGGTPTAGGCLSRNFKAGPSGIHLGMGERPPGWISRCGNRCNSEFRE